MLASLTIQNVVLIERLTIDFRGGLCALTGETGAGKSILLDSLGLALGARSDAGLVRRGSDQASVTASFDLPTSHIAYQFLKDNDVETDGDLILRRSVSKDGRSKAFINDQAVSVNLLKQVGAFLVEIHGQFDTQFLLNPQYHIGMLDAYAEHEDKLLSLKKNWKQWKEALKLYETEKGKINQAREDEEFYRTSLEDLDALSPEAGEEEKLSNLRERLMRREKILESLQEAEIGLSEIENHSATVWRALNRLGDEGADITAAMNRVTAEIAEVSDALQSLSIDVQNEDQSLQDIDDRLFALKSQARKHGCSIDQLSAKRDEIAASLNAIENQDGNLQELMRKVEAYREKYIAEAKKLSQSRLKNAQKLQKLIMAELPPLKLEKARFEISCIEQDEDLWNENGIDKVDFLVATNPGAEAGALNKIASGGELSRFMLALKVVLAAVGSAQSLVFDEVDSGIGGATAAAVGERLAKLAEYKQILVVTHSPQVAAMATHHWIVAKEGTKEIKTNIVPLFDAPMRREEIARMLAGAEITEEARAAANKLLEASAA